MNLSGICAVTAAIYGYLIASFRNDRSQRELNIFTTQFVNAWVSAHPAVLVKYENRNFKEPTGGIWVSFSISSGKVVDAAIGGLVVRGIGFVALQIFFAENFGTIQARQLADDFAACFGRMNFTYSDNVSSGNIWTLRPAYAKSPLRAGWIQWTVTIDFKHDQYSAPVSAIP